MVKIHDNLSKMLNQNPVIVLWTQREATELAACTYHIFYYDVSLDIQSPTNEQPFFLGVRPQRLQKKFTYWCMKVDLTGIRQV